MQLHNYIKYNYNESHSYQQSVDPNSFTLPISMFLDIWHVVDSYSIFLNQMTRLHDSDPAGEALQTSSRTKQKWLWHLERKFFKFLFG